MPPKISTYEELNVSSLVHTENQRLEYFERRGEIYRISLKNKQDEIKSLGLELVELMEHPLSIAFDLWRSHHTPIYYRIMGEVAAARDDCLYGRYDKNPNKQMPPWWNSSLLNENIANGIISYPPSLNQNNKGAKASFLFALCGLLNNEGQRSDEIEDLMIKIGEAKSECRTSTYWDKSI